ncbi:MAG: hypothetical protein WCO48_02160 [Candidatus Taylorbacteria bacterium]
MNKLKDLLRLKYLPYLAVTLIIILPWFFRSGYIFLTDMSWGPNISLDWTGNWFFVNLVVKFFSLIFSVAFLEKVFIGFTIFVVLVGGKKIADYIIKICSGREDRLVAFTVALFALFNPFVYDRLLYGQTGIILAFGFFLLASAYLLEYLSSNKTRDMILFGVFAALTLQMSIHFIFYIGIFFVVFLVLYIKNGVENWKHFLKLIATVGAICILLNINWLVADISGKSTTYNFVEAGITHQDLVAFKTSGSSDAQVLSNVVMMSGFWGKDQFRYADLTQVKENWGRAFLLLLPIIIFGAYLGIKKLKDNLPNPMRPLTIAMLITFVVSVILASGVALSSIAPISYWLFDHFPFYKGLRESQKWVSVIVLVYTIFFSMGLIGLSKTKILSGNRKTFLIFIGLIIIMQAPFILWGYWGQTNPVQYPSDWSVVDRGLNCKDGEQILFLPWHMYMSFGWIGRIVSNPAKQFFTCPTITSSATEWGGIYDNSQSTDGKSVSGWIQSKGRTDHSSLTGGGLNIKYVILAKELDWRNYDWLNTSSKLKLIKETYTLRVYERQD